MKRCKECGVEKAETDFYVVKGNRDGLTGKCRMCIAAQVREHRTANLQYVKAFDRNRNNDPDRIAARKAYAKTANGRERLAIGSKEWAIRNPDKRRAHVAVSNAIRAGRLIKAPCERCSSMKVQAHHDDYAKPLVVRWFCIPCHALEHRGAP